MEGITVNKDMLVSATMSFYRLMITYDSADAVRHARMVKEMNLILDLANSIVRIRNAVWDTSSTTHRTPFKNAPECTNRIRPMNWHCMCFDCRMMYDTVILLLRLIKNDVCNIPERMNMD